jgi:hypothetical protein
MRQRRPDAKTVDRPGPGLELPSHGLGPLTHAGDAVAGAGELAETTVAVPSATERQGRSADTVKYSATKPGDEDEGDGRPDHQLRSGTCSRLDQIDRTAA